MNHMMKEKTKMKKLMTLVLALAMILSLAACGGSSSSAPSAPAAASGEAPAAPAAVETDPSAYLKGKNIRVVIGATSVTGDTYLTADLVTRMIGEKYGCNMKVDPIGAGRAFEEIVSTKGEDTIMMFHDMTYLGVLFHVTLP